MENKQVLFRDHRVIISHQIRGLACDLNVTLIHQRCTDWSLTRWPISIHKTCNHRLAAAAATPTATSRTVSFPLSFGCDAESLREHRFVFNPIFLADAVSVYPPAPACRHFKNLPIRGWREWLTGFSGVTKYLFFLERMLCLLPKDKEWQMDSLPHAETILVSRLTRHLRAACLSLPLCR